MSEELNFRMTDVEERLSSDDGANVKSEILNRLETLGQEVDQKTKVGLPTEDFQKAQKLYQALAAAHEIISVFPTEEVDEKAT